MNARQDSVFSPSVHSTPDETYSGQCGCHGGFADEQPADAFPDDTPDDEELDRMWVAEQERRDREAIAARYAESVADRKLWRTYRLATVARDLRNGATFAGTAEERGAWLAAVEAELERRADEQFAKAVPYIARVAELNERYPAPPQGWHDAPCVGCYAALLVRDGTSGPVLCSECEAATEVAV